MPAADAFPGVAHYSLAVRWTVFHVVGALGMAVQLGVLAALVRLAHLDYRWAVAIAVEAAVLHNFGWHQRWTWGDRPPRSARESLARLVRFHLTNGAVSIVGNLLVVGGLTGLLGLDPVVASLAAIALCSTVNFAAGTSVVFRAVPAAALALALAPPAFASAQPAPGAVEAWTRYAGGVDARHAHCGEPFFVQDRLEGNTAWRTAVMQGHVTSTSVEAPDTPGAQVHHWVGAVFVPGATVDEVIGQLQDQAGTEERLYEDVVASRLLARDGSRLRVFMKLRRKAVLTVVYNTEHLVEYRRCGPRRAISRSVATRIAELSEPGTRAEREKPAASDSGFLWRLNAYWRYEETRGGVLIECESVSLSRSVPMLARPIVSPIVRRVARESLVRTLVGLRSALQPRVLP